MEKSISIVIPIHDMKDGDKFLWRNINSIMAQTYKKYEIIIVKNGKMAENINSGIRKAKGDLIKFLFLDDCFSHSDVLRMMVTKQWINGGWVVAGSHNNQSPYWTDNIETGNNKLGSPSAILIPNDKIYFDENMSWMLDCDYYKELYKRYGKPTILEGDLITIGEGGHQMTHILTDEEKQKEYNYMQTKWQ